MSVTCGRSVVFSSTLFSSTNKTDNQAIGVKQHTSSPVFNLWINIFVDPHTFTWYIYIVYMLADVPWILNFVVWYYSWNPQKIVYHKWEWIHIVSLMTFEIKTLLTLEWMHCVAHLATDLIVAVSWCPYSVIAP